MSALPAQNVIPLEAEPQPVPSKATLYAKLARVTGKVQRIQKNGWNDFHKYYYATASDIYDGVRAALAEENVAFLVDMVKAERDGKRTKLEFDFTFACGDTGAVKVCRWESESDDNGDKGINKASTFAVKYFLIATFLIATGDVADDPDAAAPTDDKAAKPAKPKVERRVGTSNGAPPPPAAEPNGKAEPLFQHLMSHVKHPRYQDSKARANAINKLILADLLPDGERAALVKRVEHYATLRDDGKDENAAMLEIRKELQRPPAAG